LHKGTFRGRLRLKNVGGWRLEVRGLNKLGGAKKEEARRSGPLFRLDTILVD